MKTRARSLLPIAIATLVAGCGFLGGRSERPAPPPLRSARADVVGPAGERIGQASFQQTPHGVLLTADLTGLPAGTHAMHIHETGRCTPSFEAAGDHFNPHGKAHGIRDPNGMHAGDLPNIHVVTAGTLRVEVLAREISLATGSSGLMDADGSALVVHALADDYATQPSGAAGARIACGVITR